MKTLEGWEERLLGELVVIQGGFAFRSSDFEDDGIPIIRMSDLKDGRIDFGGCVRVKASKLKALSSFSLNSGDFLVGMSGSIDNYAIVRDTDLPAYLNQRVGRFRLRDNNLADYGYIVQIARSHPYRLHVGLHAAGAAQVNISPSQIESFRFMLPPKHEQSKIAEILSTVDLAIEQTEALIAKQERIKTGLMQDLLTRGIDEHGNLRSEEAHQFKDSPLGGIPVEWEVTTLGTAVGRNKGSVQTGPFGSQLHAEDYRETGVPIITVEHLSQNRILHRNLPLVGEEDYRRLVKYTLCEGDLVFSRVGAIDRCSYVSKDENGWLFSGRCFRVRSGQEINSRYLSYQLNHDKARNWILNNSVGTTMACLNTSILSMTPVLLPQQKEQAQVARLLDFISDAIQYELLRKAKLNSLKTGLMQDLLTGKIRVTSLLDNMEVTNR